MTSFYAAMTPAQNNWFPAASLPTKENLKNLIIISLLTTLWSPGELTYLRYGWYFVSKTASHRRAQRRVTLGDVASGPVSANSLPFRPERGNSSWLVSYTSYSCSQPDFFSNLYMSHLPSTCLACSRCLKPWEYISILTLIKCSWCQKRHWRKRRLVNPRIS